VSAAVVAVARVWAAGAPAVATAIVVRDRAKAQCPAVATVIAAHAQAAAMAIVARVPVVATVIVVNPAAAMAIAANPAAVMVAVSAVPWVALATRTVAHGVIAVSGVHPIAAGNNWFVYRNHRFAR
jgi:hypothetical protein